DEDIINKNLKEFIRRNAFYNSLYDNAELLERSPDNYEKVVKAFDAKRSGILWSMRLDGVRRITE
ncbi:MAG: hypothetical protein IKM91_04855, partial [Candidatus Methanomethylophilaceae archaeon]|nr:hypothetical protein [Candidatus Methanomethylophilaceae archaeon]